MNENVTGLRYSDMAINPMAIDSEEAVYGALGNMKSLSALIEATKKFSKINLIQIARYVVLLYSADSVLNSKPAKPLKERQHMAAQIAGIKTLASGEYPKAIKLKLFDLKSAEIFAFVFEYMVSQWEEPFTEMVILERQLRENQLMRFTDANTLADSEKKVKLIAMGKVLKKELTEARDDFFNDHSNVVEEMKEKRMSMATIENFAR